MDNFRGVSLSSIVCKVMCMVLNVRLSTVAEERLIAEEQGGFRKMRGCRDQVLSLVLLGQMEMLKESRGLMAAFIDFSKAYDRIDRGKLWKCLDSMGVNGKFLSFLQSLYADTSCRVKVGDRQSRVMNVNVGLRQGCVLSPVLFSLYINSFVDQLKNANCGIECAGEVIPGLLFADDTTLLAPDESGIKRSLDVLVEWCRDWGVKVNVSKSGIMHVRQKRVARTDVQYVIDNEEIPMVEQYKYLGCVVDEHLELKVMVEERALMGRKALGAWFHRCRTELGDIGVGVFRKLMASLVESTMLYGSEIWGCNQDLEKIDQVQLRALRLFFGVGTLHPKVSLLAEMGDLPVKWLARMQCVMFWGKVLTSRTYDGRLLRRIAAEALKFGKGNWICKMSVCWGQFGWKDVNVEVLKELSTGELKEMLVASAWRKVREEWDQEMETKPKLEILKRIVKLEEWSDCARVVRRAERRIMIKLRGGTAQFQIETGRWKGVTRHERICKECDSGEVEDVEHWLMRCEAWKPQRVNLEAWMQRHGDKYSTQDSTASLLSAACSNYDLLSIVVCMWHARFN